MDYKAVKTLVNFFDDRTSSLEDVTTIGVVYDRSTKHFTLTMNDGTVCDWDVEVVAEALKQEALKEINKEFGKRLNARE